MTENVKKLDIFKVGKFGIVIFQTHGTSFVYSYTSAGRPAWTGCRASWAKQGRKKCYCLKSLFKPAKAENEGK